MKTETGRLEFWTPDDLSLCDFKSLNLDFLVLQLLSLRDFRHTVNFGMRKSVKSLNKENETEIFNRPMSFADSNINSTSYNFWESENIFGKCGLPHLEDSPGYAYPTIDLNLQAKVKNKIFIS